jgi:SprT protein
LQLSLFQPKSNTKRKLRLTTLPEIREILSASVPECAIEKILSYFSGYPVHFKIVKQRHSKSGDFRPAQNGNPHRITINSNLNNYAFLITLVHEIAHLHGTRLGKTLFLPKSSPNPHGKQWKSDFRELMKPFLTPEVFPHSVLQLLIPHMENPKASASADSGLSRLLMQFDQPSGGVHLEELPQDAFFRIHNGKLFQKKDLLRKRYRCLSLTDGRVYLINPVAIVYPSASTVSF